ncbi:terpene synthase family protein [Streptomyces sp. NPDC046727]|uniref:terpene synthase family protein n=1 Tax=Streptomyces sp. NPDC046727 TaxID=3155373 RepID=UPI0033F607C4
MQRPPERPRPLRLPPLTGSRTPTAAGAGRRRSLVEAFVDLRRRTAVRGSPAWRERFERSLAQLLAALEGERRSRCRGDLPGVERYLELRRVTGYTPLLYLLTEELLGCEAPAGVRSAEPFRQARTASVDAIDLINELYSLPKELARGESHNFVVLYAREHPCGLDRAVPEAGRRVREAVDRFRARWG